MSAKAIVERFAHWRATGRTLALATVCETAGSTYSKPGHRILIADGGEYQGLVSGGCLEGDLAGHARQVMDSGKAAVVTYDMRGAADEVFGLGIGCDGLIRVLLQRLSPADGYEPFAAIATVLLGATPGACAVVVEPGTGALTAGATLVVAGGRQHGHALPTGDAARLAGLCQAVATTDPPRLATLAPDGATVLVAPLRPLPRLLVLGAGPDAVPLVNIAATTGWRVTVCDHRPANFSRGDFAAAEQTVCAPAAEVFGKLNLAEFAAVVVMSHHQATDRSYLQQLAAHPLAYMGLLGPKARRDRLVAELGPAGRELAARLRGPAGLDIGADSPEAIALSIVAEIEAVLAGRVGKREAAR